MVFLPPKLRPCIQSLFNTPKTAPQWQKFSTNIASGGLAGSASLLGVYSLDYKIFHKIQKISSKSQY